MGQAAFLEIRMGVVSSQDLSSDEAMVEGISQTAEAPTRFLQKSFVTDLQSEYLPSTIIFCLL